MTDDRQYSLGFQSLDRFITEKFYNIQKDEVNNYIREEIEEECKRNTTENIAEELLTIFQRHNKSNEVIHKRCNRIENILIKLFCKKDIARFINKYKAC